MTSTVLRTIHLRLFLLSYPNNFFVNRDLLLDENGEFKKLGETIKIPKLAKTLETIRDDPMSFYNGSIAESIADDKKKAGGIITLDDLKNYTVEVTDPIVNQMGSKRWFAVPPPASGAVITLILNIMKGILNFIFYYLCTGKNLEP